MRDIIVLAAFVTLIGAIGVVLVKQQEIKNDPTRCIYPPRPSEPTSGDA
jgi:hypothetical protein